MCGETLYGRHTAQHPAAVTTNNNEKFRSFKSKENIHEKEVGPYCDFTAVSAIKASSVTLTWQKEPVEDTVNLQFLTWQKEPVK